MAKKKTVSQEEPSQLTEYEKYEIVLVERSQLKNAPYNPRKITPEAREYLRQNLKSRGLTHPPTWNRVTGNLVAGHQRLSVLDSLHRSQNYKLHVAAVDLDAQTEKEQNIFENNPNAQGYFEIEDLEKMFREENVDFTKAGFTLGEVYKLFGDTPMVDKPDQMIELAEKIRAVEERYQRMSKRSSDHDDVNFYLMVVFPSNEKRKHLTDALGEEDNRYMDGEKLAERFQITQGIATAASERLIGLLQAAAPEVASRAAALVRAALDGDDWYAMLHGDPGDNAPEGPPPPKAKRPRKKKEEAS